MGDQKRTRRQLQIDADVCLVDELLPPPKTLRFETAGVALITGGTGFLGRYIIRELIENTSKQIICLVRANTQRQAQDRLVESLQSIGVSNTLIMRRIEVIAGDIELERFGLEQRQYKALSAQVDQVYHSAAKVNWVRNYASLRSTNVLGTLEVIRFACETRSKSIVFVSSIAVCYANSLRGCVDESTNLLPHIVNMPLGYAQTKCVAESLLRKMHALGLPVSIVRPSLISGDSQTGQSSTGDLMAAVVKGCVLSGAASDVDWAIDNVPVDYVAKVIVQLPVVNTSSLKGGALHICHDKPRHWRELVLMLNLYGYAIDLIPMSQWLDHVPNDRALCGDLLYTYRHFFLQPLAAGNSNKIYELYLNLGQSLLVNKRSQKLLAEHGLTPPQADAQSLRRALQFWQREKVLPFLPKQAPLSLEHFNIVGQLSALVRSRIRATDVKVLGIEALPVNVDDSILSELLAVSDNRQVGLSAWRVNIQDGESTKTLQFDYVIKSRSDDTKLIDACICVAALCSERLRNLVSRYKSSLGLEGGLDREQALYALRIPKLRRHTPRSLGGLYSADGRCQALVLERVNEIEIDATDTGLVPWSMNDMDCVLDGLAKIQSVPLDAMMSKMSPGILQKTRTFSQTIEMTPLWHELISCSEQFTKSISPSLSTCQYQLLDTLADWWKAEYSALQVLVHNDFNPRNLALRQTSRGRQLCTFDWELAVIGPPQKDLAEFLCFTADPDTLTKSTLFDIVGRHRQRLITLGLVVSNEKTWNTGFAVALREFMITRLPWYALMHRFSPQRQLDLCSRNASVIYTLTTNWLASTDEDVSAPAAKNITSATVNVSVG